MKIAATDTVRSGKTEEFRAGYYYRWPQIRWPERSPAGLALCYRGHDLAQKHPGSISFHLAAYAAVGTGEEDHQNNAVGLRATVEFRVHQDVYINNTFAKNQGETGGPKRRAFGVQLK
jgi:hypothetical protein